MRTFRAAHAASAAPYTGLLVAQTMLENTINRGLKLHHVIGDRAYLPGERG
ncbi:hypothetical protein H9651_05785 [Microbacterium sp. Sa4CUA7]|uniref:Transposase n=1 Tax=Microbacterium pullorum TaxID=2762236 RepID=A0ABR8S101_9MICO|nr:hypothetical protein [Microbacterium pullorum]MBD7957140.1 hypothetical protein [Microbacterium pullorum]